MKTHRYLSIIPLFVIFLLFIGMEHIAASPYYGFPWETPLQKFQYILTGPVGKAFSLILIVVPATTLIFGERLNIFIRILICFVLGVGILLAINSLFFG